MEINNNMKKSQTVPFCTIKCGEMFIDEDNDVMMRTEDNEPYNVVDLKDGCVYSFRENESVTPINQEISFLKKQKEIDITKNRKKVILHRRDYQRDDYKLSLTQEQIDLLDWLMNEDLISPDEYDMQILEEVDTWVEV